MNTDKALYNQKIFFQVIFSDESSFEVQLAQPRLVRRGSEPIRDAHIAQRVKRPQMVMIWGCMSSRGFGKIHIVEGSMDSRQYAGVIQSRLLPQAAEWFQGNSWIFMQDNAPCHTSRMTKAVFDQNSIEVLPWPSNSPDMNPIETVWGFMKQKINQEISTSKQSLIN
ncbi:MAG: transposase, partial [Pseudomonadota bacterium]